MSRAALQKKIGGLHLRPDMQPTAIAIHQQEYMRCDGGSSSRDLARRRGRWRAGAAVATLVIGFLGGESPELRVGHLRASGRA